MPSGTTNLTIALKSNMREGQGILSFVKNLNAEMVKFSKSQKDMRQSDGPQAGFSKALLENKKVFDDLGKAGKNYAKILKDDVAKGMSEVDAKLSDNTRKLKVAIEQYEKLQKLKKGAAAGSADAEFVEERLQLARHQMNKTSIENSALRQEKRGLAGPGMREQVTSLAQNIPGGGALARAATGPAGIAMAVFQAIGLANSVYRSGLSRETSVAGAQLGYSAQFGQATGAARTAAFGGDLSTMFYHRKIAEDANLKNQLQQKIHTRQAEAESAASVFSDIQEAVSHPLDLMGSELSSIYHGEKRGMLLQRSEMKKNLQAQKNAIAAAALGETISQAENENPEEKAFLNYIMSTVGTGANINRAFGGKRIYQDVVKTLGITKDAATAEEVGGAMMGVRSQAGSWGALGLKRAISRKIGQGMDIGSVVGIAGAGAIAQRAGTNVPGDMLSMLGRPGLYGDTALQGVLGNNAAQFMGSQSMIGVGSPEGMQGLVNTLATGTGPQNSGAMNRRILDQNASGMASGQSLFTGNTSYQKSVNLINAIKVLGKGSSLEAQHALSNIDYASAISMIRSKDENSVPAPWRAMGIGLKQIREYVAKTFGSTLNTWADVGAKDRASNLMRHIKKVGLDVWQAGGGGGGPLLSKNEENTQIAGAMISNLQGGTMGGETAVTGWLRTGDLTGAGEIPKRSKKGAKTTEPVQDELIAARVTENVAKAAEGEKQVKAVKDLTSTLTVKTGELHKVLTQIRDKPGTSLFPDHGIAPGTKITITVGSNTPSNPTAKGTK